VNYLVQTSGNKALKHYTSIDATHYRQWLQDKGLANASVHKAFACIKAIFTLAIKEQGLTMQNPFSNIYLPSEKDDAKKRLPIAIAYPHNFILSFIPIVN
jgi:site-specific recombinase XerD